MKYILGVLFIATVMLTACGDGHYSGEDGTDPVLTWDAVITNCIGEPISGVRYNVYAVSGAGSIPTIPSADTEPCGVVQLASIAPMNSTPLTATTYNAVVPDGVWTFAVDAVNASGNRGGLSNQVTVTVVGRPAPVINLTTGKITREDEE